MNQIVLKEEMKAENGGPGLPGEQIFRPGQLGPGQPRQRSQEPSSPADIGRDLLQSGQPQSTPAPAPSGPLGPGVTVTPTPQGAPQTAPSQGAPATGAPPSGTAGQPSPPAQTQPAPQTTPPPSDERLQVQPR